MPTNQDTMTADAGNNRLMWCLAVVIFAVSAAMMIVSARGDLAIDEVVSLNNTLSLHGWPEIFTQDQNDNNHLLNTLFMRAFGEQTHLFVYRIPAVIFGVAFLALLMAVSRRLGKSLPLWVACLSGLSYPMVLYSSEARGYIPAMFFAVLSFEMLQRCWERCTPGKLLLFWTVLGLGILSHFSFIMVCMALGIWFLAHEFQAGASLRAMALGTLKYFAVPVVFLAAIYLFFIRHMVIYGGPVPTRWEAISDAALYLLGFAAENWLRGLGILLSVVLVVAGIWKLIAQKRGEWVFFVAILFVAPFLVIMLWQPKFLYFRYFCVCFPFFYLLLAYVFANWFGQGGKMRLITVVLVAAITAGHLVKISALVRYGRGNYRQALLDMAAATTGPVISVSSDHDFRNGTLVAFYARFLPPSKQVRYVVRADRDQVKPDWFIQHCGDPTFNAYEDVEVGGIGKYDLFNTYLYCGSSGWSWFVYHRDPNATPATAQATQLAGATNNAAR